MSRNVGFVNEDEESDEETQPHHPRLPNNRRLRDTFALASPLRISDSGMSSNSSQSEPESVLPELSNAEERALRLSGAQFEPIKSLPKHDDEEQYKSFSNWKPSEDVARGIEGVSGINRTRIWNDDGIEIKHEKQGEISIIPNTTRESTPDSVMNTGKIMIGLNRSDKSAFQVNRGNLQDNQSQENKRTLALSTRNKVKDMNKYQDTCEHEKAGAIEMQPVVGLDEVDTGMSGKENKKNNRCDILPKMIGLIVAIMIILACIVALIVKFRDTGVAGEKGKILPNRITHAECTDISVSLGEKLNFTCSFDLNHEHRKQLSRYYNAKVVPENMVIDDDRLKFTVKQSTDGKKNLLTLIFTSDWTARCSTQGRYFVHLKSKNQSVLLVANVNVHIKPSTLRTSFEQYLHVDDCQKPSDDVKTYFEAICYVSGDCNSYEPSIVGLKYQRVESLNHLMECHRNFTDARGYNLECKAEIHEDLVDGYNQIQCRVNSARKKQEKRFSLPVCQPTPTCTTATALHPFPFNCSAKSNHIENIKNASCNFDALRNCLQPGQKILRMHKDLTGDLKCYKSTTTVPVCRLAWCSDYSYITKYLSPGNTICGSGFVEQEYVPPATSTTSDPSNVTSGRK
ncbi:hypothetical protein ACF0H5_020926 [Mactra antiquata]